MATPTVRTARLAAAVVVAAASGGGPGRVVRR